MYCLSILSGYAFSMRISIFLILIFLLKTTSFAGHIGCLTIYERSLCETEQTFQYKSESLSWELTKDEFKTKLVSFLDKLMPEHEARLGHVFLWVNDFNSQSALRVHVWTAEKNFIVDVPVDITQVNLDTDLTIRGAGRLPYPVDFGYTLGEVIVSCVDECTQQHKGWLLAAGVLDVQPLLPKMYLAKVPKFSEAKTIENLKEKAGFDILFNAVELSPVMEGNGFRDMAFVVYF